jgi:copper chaperone CopZ
MAQSKEIIIQTTAQCGECKEIIEKALMAEKGVRFAELDVKSKKAKVVYNEKRTGPEQLRKAIAGVGYDADDVPADEAAVKKLNPCCTKDGHRD